MAQQAIKFVQRRDSNDTQYTTTIVADAVTSLDADEDFRLVVEDTMPISEVADKVQQLLMALRGGQLVLDAAVL